jgi:hypothetical protein
MGKRIIYGGFSLTVDCTTSWERSYTSRIVCDDELGRAIVD